MDPIGSERADSKITHMQTLKKVFSSFVALTTVVWSVGGALLFPGAAQAATITPGDLIKASSSSSVYYYAEDGKRYVFPNEKTYFSWYSDFSSVVTITDAELAAIYIGGNVVVRPGTKLVKITTDPKTYAVSNGCGLLHWIQTEDIAKSLYGDSWNQRIVDVPDVYFQDYEIGSAVASAIHPDGQIIHYASDASTYYVVMGGVKRKLTSSGITANKLNTANAVVTTITYANGTDVTAYEAAIGKVACAGATVQVTGNVNVALASDTPAGKTLPKNGASIELAKFTLTADSNAGLISGISVKRTGVGASSDFSNVYLYDADGNRLTTGRTINSSTNVVTFNGLNLSIPANSTKSIVLVGDLSNPSTTGGQHAFQIADAASVVITGTGKVGGTFPATGNVFTVGTITAGTVTVDEGTDPSDVTIGAKDVEIANFKLSAATNDIEVRRIALTIDDGGATLSDFKLYQGSAVVGTSASMVNDLAVINLDPAYVLAEGVTKTFSLHATVAGRSGYTIKTYVENSTDVMAVDRLYNSGAAVTIDEYDGDTVDTQYSEIQTIGGQLTRAFNGPATGNITKGGQDVVLYNFALTSSDSDLDVRKLRFSVNGSAATSTNYLSDFKVKNVDTGAVVAGPQDTFTDAAEFILTDSFTIPAGKTVNLQVTGDIANDSMVVDDTFAVSLEPVVAGDIKIVSSNQNLAVADIIPNTQIVGNTMTVIASSLSVSLAATPAATTVVKKQSDIPTAGFVFTAGNDQGATISQILLQGSASTTPATGAQARANFNDVIASCGLYDGNTLIKSDGPDSTGVLSFSSLNIAIAKGATKTLVAKCTTLSTITGTPVFAVGLSSVTAQDSDSNEITVSTTAADNNLDVDGNRPTIAQTLANNGTGSLSISTGSQPESTIILGAADVKLAEFRATAVDEAIQITKVHVTSTGNAASLTEVKIRVKGSDTVYGTAVLASGVSSNVTSTLTTPIVVDKDATKTIEVWGHTGSVVSPLSASGAKSGNTILLAVKPTSFEAYGLASGEKLAISSSDVSGNTMVLRKSKPTVTVLSVPSTLSSGVQKDLIKFQVSADVAGDVAWKQIIFTVSTTSHVTGLASFKLYRGASDITTDSVSSTLSSYNGAGVYTLTLKDGKEEVVSGSGVTYTLSATPTLTSPASGDSLTTKIREEAAATTVVTNTFEASAASAVITGQTAVNSSFVWSDLSIPGSPAVGNADWTNGVYVKDLTTQSALVY